MNSGVNSSILGFIFLPLIGLGLFGIIFLFGIFSIEKELKLIKKNDRELLKEQRQYDKEQKEFKDYLNNNVNTQKKKSKSREIEAEKAKEAKKKNDILKKKLEETEKRDEARRAKEAKELLKKKLEETEKKDEARRAKEAKELLKKKPVETEKKNENKIEKTNQIVEQVEVKQKAKTQKKEQLPKAKEETTKSKNEVVFVNYQISKVEITNTYPVFRFPQKGTVVRSYRLGNTKRRGFKEESFQNSIEYYFGKQFTVLGNARLNTGKETRPFEPDIAIIDNSNTTNLRIDVEIDEPYAGITRQPTHCKGDDINRDIYFIDRGWVVIRFSEYQVHLQEKECLRFIAETIKLVISKYEIPNQLISPSSLQVEKLWDIVQAQKWEKAKYREQYLNHSFQATEEQTETIERDFDEQELNEEKLVTPTSIGEFDNKKLKAFNLRNAHSRDNRIKFYPKPHIYTIDNTPAPSVSTISAKFFPEFDSIYWSNRKAPELGMSASEVERMWRVKGEKAAQDGTFLHEQIENFYLNQKYQRTEEFHLFEKFVNEHSSIEPYRTEWRVFDEHHHIAGTIDLISKSSVGFEIYDWKRSKKVVDSYTGEPIKINQWQSGVGHLSDIDDTSYNRYCLQQSLYKYILEKNYGLKVSKMFLIVLYPEYENYYKIEVPYLKDKAEYILRTL